MAEQIVDDPGYPDKPQEAIFRACERAERQFTQMAISGTIEHSGSCGVAMLVLSN